MPDTNFPSGILNAQKSISKLFGLCILFLITACDTVATGPSATIEAEGYSEPIVEPALIIASEREVSETFEGSTAPRHPRPRKGILTAGDIDDTRNLAQFQRYLEKAARETKLPVTDLSKPVLARLVGPNGRPAPGVHVTLRKPGASSPFYQGYSGVDGHITVFPSIYGKRLAQVELRAFPAGQGEPVVQTIKTGKSRLQVDLPFQGTKGADFLDLVFVVDTTGSMADELEWLTRELEGVVRKAKNSAPGVDIRYGLVVYRDRGDEYVVRNYGFTDSQSKMVGWLRKQHASGGGDYPEAAAEALASGAALNWRRGSGERLMFHIADAPPHRRDSAAYLKAAKLAARSNVQIFGLGASGVAAESEYLMRQAAVMTSGRYMFLTDDSGLGNTHAEPTISCYQVTHLNDLMLRVLRSELSGHRVEPSSGTILRSVGSYTSGKCQN